MRGINYTTTYGEGHKDVFSTCILNVRTCGISRGDEQARCQCESEERTLFFMVIWTWKMDLVGIPYREPNALL
jgi:hypothetical protein